MEKSMLNVAFEYVEARKGEIPFKEIWDHVTKTLGFTKEEAEQKIATFYSNLMLDGRFVTLGDNKWTLRIREKYDKVHIDMNAVYSDVESDTDTSDADDSAAEDLRAEKDMVGEEIESELNDEASEENKTSEETEF